jgi:hypothetical protein
VSEEARKEEMKEKRKEEGKKKRKERKEGRKEVVRRSPFFRPSACVGPCD